MKSELARALEEEKLFIPIFLGLSLHRNTLNFSKMYKRKSLSKNIQMTEKIDQNWLKSMYSMIYSIVHDN